MIEKNTTDRYYKSNGGNVIDNTYSPYRRSGAPIAPSPAPRQTRPAQQPAAMSEISPFQLFRPDQLKSVIDGIVERGKGGSVRTFVEVAADMREPLSAALQLAVARNQLTRQQQEGVMIRIVPSPAAKTQSPGIAPVAPIAHVAPIAAAPAIPPFNPADAPKAVDETEAELSEDEMRSMIGIPDAAGESESSSPDEAAVDTD